MYFVTFNERFKKSYTAFYANALLRSTVHICRIFVSTVDMQRLIFAF